MYVRIEEIIILRWYHKYDPGCIYMQGLMCYTGCLYIERGFMIIQDSNVTLIWLCMHMYTYTIQCILSVLMLFYQTHKNSSNT